MMREDFSGVTYQLWQSLEEGTRAARPHSEHHFPAPSSELCQNWLRLRTLPELVTPPNFARTGYASELCQNWLRLRTLPELVTPKRKFFIFISGRLSTDARSVYRLSLICSLASDDIKQNELN